jgi:transcriptional regulator with XRE-family HTH domain
MMTGEQIKAARALLRMEQRDLSEAAGVSLDTVKRLEQMRGRISANTATEDAIRRALSAAGVIVLDENGEGAGVRLRKSGGAE